MLCLVLVQFPGSRLLVAKQLLDDMEGVPETGPSLRIQTFQRLGECRH